MKRNREDYWEEEAMVTVTVTFIVPWWYRFPSPSTPWREWMTSIAHSLAIDGTEYTRWSIDQPLVSKIGDNEWVVDWSVVEGHK